MIGEATKPFTDKQIARRKGGLTGGKKRMEALTPDQRLGLAAKGRGRKKNAGILRSRRS